MEDLGLVSIITPSYNSARFVAQTIESIKNQTYSNWELLITDDGSTDDSQHIISEFIKDDTRIKLFVLEGNSGAAVARNNSIKHAKGRFIAFCDSDDCWYPTKLEEQLQFMKERDCFLSYTSYDIMNEAGKKIGHFNCLRKTTFAKILQDDGIGCLTAIYDAGKIGKVYMPLLRKRQDWGLWIQIIKKFGPAYGLQKRLAIYRKRSDSISANKMKLFKYHRNIYTQVASFNRVNAELLMWLYYIPYNIYKKINIRLSSLFQSKSEE